MRAQTLRQIAIELNNRKLPQTLYQGLGKRSQPGTNFHDTLPWLGMDGIYDGIDDAAVSQKVLTESLASYVFH
jgi:hypothetical protein